MNWKDVVGYEDILKVSDCGSVWSKRSSKILKQTSLKTGYLVVNTKIGGRKGISVSLRVHRMVAEAFLPEPSIEQLQIVSETVYGKVLVNHKDGVKTNNNVLNLEWCTHSENMKHAVSLGLIDNSRNHNATAEQVEFIINNAGKISNREIARRLKICRSTVGLVIKKHNSPVV